MYRIVGERGISHETSQEPDLNISPIDINTSSSVVSHTHSISKRHEDDESHHEEDDDHHDNDPTQDPKKSLLSLRCGHVTTPTEIYTTPLLGDFDHDGQLDVVYVIVWSAGYNMDSFKTQVVGAPWEKLFVGGYGTEILDFDTFLPPSEQPWTQYMGHKGDSVFTLSDT